MSEEITPDRRRPCGSTVLTDHEELSAKVWGLLCGLMVLAVHVGMWL